MCRSLPTTTCEQVQSSFVQLDPTLKVYLFDTRAYAQLLLLLLNKCLIRQCKSTSVLSMLAGECEYGINELQRPSFHVGSVAVSSKFVHDLDSILWAYLYLFLSLTTFSLFHSFMTSSCYLACDCSHLRGFNLSKTSQIFALSAVHFRQLVVLILSSQKS